jgi:hypothetical protein
MSDGVVLIVTLALGVPLVVLGAYAALRGVGASSEHVVKIMSISVKSPGPGLTMMIVGLFVAVYPNYHLVSLRAGGATAIEGGSRPTEATPGDVPRGDSAADGGTDDTAPDGSEVDGTGAGQDRSKDADSDLAEPVATSGATYELTVANPLDERIDLDRGLSVPGFHDGGELRLVVPGYLVPISGRIALPRAGRRRESPCWSIVTRCSPGTTMSKCPASSWRTVLPFAR